MIIRTVTIAEVKPYQNNPRKNTKAVGAVAESIRQCGYCAPIVVDEEMVILAGHTRLRAVESLGWANVEVCVKEGLTDEQKRKYRLLDNKTNELAEWDFELLADELSELDFEGFDFGFPPFSSDSEVVEDNYEVELPLEPKTKLGDIYQLGRHRLMCGDSTDNATVETLMDGNKADMVFTDPPYNIGYQGVSDKRTIQNDKMTDEDFVDFLEKALMPCETMYVCCSWQYSHLFRQALENIGQKIKAMIVWDKVNPAQHLDKYFKQHEIIWYCGAFGGEKTLRGDVWQCKRQKNTVHPTMKPLELIGMALQDQPKKKIVYDGFGGSGSTLIACEQLDRTCYMMELDPKYCDVIIKRWENFTGRKAEKDGQKNV